jgi:DNA-binding response OmpR family regulator
MKLLICEEEEVLITAMTFRLEKLGFEVHNARDRYKAEKAIEVINPGMLLIDLDLSNGTGSKLVDFVRNKQKLSTPILLLTQPEPELSIVEGLELGANDFITKPFKPSELLLRASLVAGLNTDWDKP